MQYFRVDFYNPLSQFIVKITTPLITPIRKIVPGFAGIDISSLLLAYLVILLKLFLLVALSGNVSFSLIYLAIYASYELLQSILGLFFFLIIIRVIVSWIAPAGYNPMIAVISQITEPIMAKFRQWLPPMSGFDFSSMLVLLIIIFLQRSLAYYILPLI